ncbi:hypothetical protein, partial [Schleiferilactobacillus harbinensis]|uniref:hypothetical protein n=1 Tax=Schleiferilactobacillus harbinensis TaxID=304207 RepID=UPI0021A4A10B
NARSGHEQLIFLAKRAVRRVLWKFLAFTFQGTIKLAGWRTLLQDAKPYNQFAGWQCYSIPGLA